MTEELDKQKVRAVWPNAYVDWFMSTHEYVIWSTDDPSEKILGRGPKKYAAWQNAAESLPVAPEQETPVAGGLSHEEHRRACKFNLPAAVFGSSPKEPKGLHGKHCDCWIVAEHRHCDKPATVCQGSKYRCDEHDPYAIEVAEPKPTPSGTEPLAEKIIRRVVENTVRFMWTRNIEPLESDPEAEFPTEEELVIDALALALGEDIGCLDEKDDDFRERIDLLWLEDQLKPEPDSSSIPEQTFEEWLDSAKEYSYYQKQLIESSNILILRLFKECWAAAKGQR